MGQTISNSFVWNLPTRPVAVQDASVAQADIDVEADVDADGCKPESVLVPIPIQLDAGAIAPVRASGGAAGFDLCAAEAVLLPARNTKATDATDATEATETTETTETTVDAGGWIKVKTGVRLAIGAPSVEGCLGDHMILYGAVRARSGLTSKGIEVFHGTIDADYRGEVLVLMKNHTHSDFMIEAGDRIAQLIFSVAVVPELVHHDDVSKFATARGSGGFGSTGSDHAPE